MIDFSKVTAILGGSFDPIHLGHIHVAKSVLANLPQIEQLVLLPAFQSPGKPAPIASPEKRLLWTKTTAEKEGFLGSNAEIKAGGTSYTVETLEKFHKNGAAKERIYLVLGADSYASFSSWKSPEKIRSLCQIVVVNRPGSFLKKEDPSDTILETKMHEASSTEIRRILKTGKIPIDLIPLPVCEELQKKNPYDIQEENGK